MIKRFLRSQRTGFYFAVVREGHVGTGDIIAFTERSDVDVTVADIAALYASDSANQELLQRAVKATELPEDWREYFRKRLWKADS